MAGVPIDPNSGLPLDPSTLQQMQQLAIARQFGGGGGSAIERQNDATIATGVNSLFPNQATQQARGAQAALASAMSNLGPQQTGESDMDYTIRQLKAQAGAVAPFSPQSADALSMKILALEQSKTEQARLTAQDQRSAEQESDLHAERQAELPVKQLAGKQAEAESQIGIPAYLGSNLSGTNPQFKSYDISDPDQRARYMADQKQPGVVPLSQKGVESILIQRQAALQRNNALMGAGSMPTDTKELLYQRYLVTGKLDTSGMTRSPGMVSDLWGYIAQRSAADGNTAGAAYANGQATAAAGQVLKSYNSGMDHQKLVAINTAVNHMVALNPLIDALQNNDIPALNAARIAFSKATGVAAPGNFDMLRNMVVGEVSQAVNRLGGSEEERKEITQPLLTAGSPEQLRGAVRTAATTLAGKTDALKLAWDTGTGGRFGDFDSKFLSPATRTMLGRQTVMPGSTAAPSVTGAAPYTFVPGQQYKDKTGATATYLGNGKWQQ